MAGRQLPRAKAGVVRYERHYSNLHRDSLPRARTPVCRPLSRACTLHPQHGTRHRQAHHQSHQWHNRLHPVRGAGQTDEMNRRSFIGLLGGGLVASAIMAEAGALSEFLSWLKRAPVWSFPTPARNIAPMWDEITAITL